MVLLSLLVNFGSLQDRVKNYEDWKTRKKKGIYMPTMPIFPGDTVDNMRGEKTPQEQSKVSHV
jgi:hypothetical protein